MNRTLIKTILLLILTAFTGCDSIIEEKTTGYVKFNDEEFLSDDSDQVTCTIDVQEGEKFVLICGMKYNKKKWSESESSHSLQILHLERTDNKIHVQSWIEYSDMKFEEEPVFKFSLTNTNSDPPKKIDFKILLKSDQQV